MIRLMTVVVCLALASAGLAAADKELDRLEEAGVEFIRSPLEEEYATLIRFVGPLAVYLRVHQFARCLAAAWARWTRRSTATSP